MSDLTDRWPFVLGALYVLTVLVLPDGVLGALSGRHREAPVSSAGPGGPGEAVVAGDGVAP